MAEPDKLNIDSIIQRLLEGEGLNYIQYQNEVPPHRLLVYFSNLAMVDLKKKIRYLAIYAN